MSHEIRLTSRGIPLIKFQSADRIEALRCGKIYAKNLEYYRALERTTGDADVGDQNEGMLPIVNAEMQIGEERMKLTEAVLRTSESNDFVFCVFQANPSVNNMRFSEEQKEKMLSFGDTALVVLDSNEFVKRVKKAANMQGLETHFKSVMYYDPTRNNVNIWKTLLEGMWNVALWKRLRYAYQQEARFVFTPGDDSIDHIELDVGDLHDITKVYRASDVLNTMRSV